MNTLNEFLRWRELRENSSGFGRFLAAVDDAMVEIRSDWHTPTIPLSLPPGALVSWGSPCGLTRADPLRPQPSESWELPI